MADPIREPGASGVFKVIRDGARLFKRAVTGGDETPNAGAHDLGTQVAQAFVAGRFADVHALATPAFRARTAAEDFVASWSDALAERGPLTGFDVSDIGAIELAFIPGLEEVPQSQFVAFLELAFSTPSAALDDPDAFVVAAVVLDHEGALRIGALHAR